MRHKSKDDEKSVFPQHLKIENGGKALNSIYSVNGPVVKVRNTTDFSMLEMVYVGNKRLIGEEDVKLSELLKKDYPEVEFKTDEHIHLGGLSVYSRKNGTISDRTFDFALDEQRKEFAGRNSFA